MARQKKTPLFRNNWNHDQPHQQDNDPVSITIPGQAFSIQELILRQKQGVPLDIFYHPEYDPNPDIDGIDREKFMRMDLAEREMVISAQAERLKHLQGVAQTELELLQRAKQEQEQLKRDNDDSNDDNAT